MGSPICKLCGGCRKKYKFAQQSAEWLYSTSYRFLQLQIENAEVCNPLMILRGKAATECMSSLYTVMEHLKIRRHRSFFFADMGMRCKKPLIFISSERNNL